MEKSFLGIIPLKFSFNLLSVKRSISDPVNRPVFILWLLYKSLTYTGVLAYKYKIIFSILRYTSGPRNS